MIEPGDLYRLEPGVPDVTGAVLVEALTGFIDAGAARQLASAHLLEDAGSQIVATFDVDLLYDYRSRRPPMVFNRDRWESYDAPSLALHLVHDREGTPFLLLAGPEPDVFWERFVTAVTQLVQRLGVRMTIGLNAIPMGVPHTRPARIIAHGTRPELVAGHEPWVSIVQVPGSAGHLLEYRLGRLGKDAMGFAVTVPHYLASSEYPASAAALVEAVAGVTGLVLPVDALIDAAARTRIAVDAEVGQSEEIAEVVRALEAQYDATQSEHGSSLLIDGARMPTAEELGAELERFLREQGGR